MQKTPLMRLTEIEHGAPIEDLIRQGVEDGLNWVQIAERLGVPYATLNDWRRSLGIRTIRTVEFASEETATPVG